MMNNGSHKIGLARVSREDQNLEMQIDALEKAGCSTIYQEHISGVLDGKEQEYALKALRPGDTLVVWKIDRLGRSTRDLLKIIEGLRERNINFMSITEGVDTSTSNGQFFFTIIAALSELERQRLIERTRAGLDAAKARGRKGGRKPAMSAKQVKQATSMLEFMTASDVAATFKVSRATLYNSINRYKGKDNGAEK